MLTSRRCSDESRQIPLSAMGSYPSQTAIPYFVWANNESRTNVCQRLSGTKINRFVTGSAVALNVRLGAGGCQGRWLAKSFNVGVPPAGCSFLGAAPPHLLKREEGLGDTPKPPA